MALVLVPGGQLTDSWSYFFGLGLGSDFFPKPEAAETVLSLLTQGVTGAVQQMVQPLFAKSRG